MLRVRLLLHQPRRVRLREEHVNPGLLLQPLRRAEKKLSNKVRRKKRAKEVLRGEALGRGTGFSQQEQLSLLGICEYEMPIGKDEWERVALAHSEEYGHKNRTYESLRRKFNGLAKMSTPTGDPACPPEVLRAKRILVRLTEEAGIGRDGGRSDDDVFEGESGDGDVQEEDDDDESLRSGEASQWDEDGPSAHADRLHPRRAPSRAPEVVNSDDDDVPRHEAPLTAPSAVPGSTERLVSRERQIPQRSQASSMRRRDSADAGGNDDGVIALI